MACGDQVQQSDFKHHCKICNKGFMCGRALGGHMRSHGIGDESLSLEDEDPASDWEEKLDESIDKTSNRRMYKLRTNPNRIKSCKACENCGKEFLSWKSFLEHGKCNSNDVGSFVSPVFSHESEGEDDTGKRQGWSKRKRSLRAKVDSFCTPTNYTYAEEEDLLLAGCLVDLANTRVDTSMGEEESCASHAEKKNLMALFSPLSSRTPYEKSTSVSKGLFECKACKKVFNSHQALGGHRASHKKVKGCYAAKQDQLDDSLADEDVITNDEYFPSKSTSSLQFEQNQNSSASRKSKVHECSICHRVFSSGQALGGHKRCHWITSSSHDNNAFAKFHFHDHHMEQIQQISLNNKSEALDLNIPAQVNEMLGLKNFEVSTEIHLHPWIDVDGKAKETDNHFCKNNQQRHYQTNEENYKNKDNINSSANCTLNVEDDANSKVKLAKLSELKDINTSGSSSQWLQVGIGSTTEIVTDP